MKKPVMVHIVDMTVEEFQEAAAMHRSRGQHTTADNMMRIPPMLAALTDEERAGLRRLSVRALQIELSRLVLAHEAALKELGT
jgi:hypothetical protein